MEMPRNQWPYELDGGHCGNRDRRPAAYDLTEPSKRVDTSLVQAARDGPRLIHQSEDLAVKPPNNGSAIPWAAEVSTYRPSPSLSARHLGKAIKPSLLS
jgi:hypothetical protein